MMDVVWAQVNFFFMFVSLFFFFFQLNNVFFHFSDYNNNETGPRWPTDGPPTPPAMSPCLWGEEGVGQQGQAQQTGHHTTIVQQGTTP
jgi:hypothetical protein